MNQNMSKIGYRVMAATLRWFKKEPYMRQRLEFAGIDEGKVVLDYGSGPGYFAALAAEMVGPSGKVYAADVQPIVREYVDKLCGQHGLKNIDVIITDCDTSLPDRSVDVVLLFDNLHVFDDPRTILEEMRRVLRDDGTLCVDVHHMPLEKAIAMVEGGGFTKGEELDNTINFSKDL